MHKMFHRAVYYCGTIRTNDTGTKYPDPDSEGTGILYAPDFLTLANKYIELGTKYDYIHLFVTESGGSVDKLSESDVVRDMVDRMPLAHAVAELEDLGISKSKVLSHAVTVINDR